MQRARYEKGTAIVTKKTTIAEKRMPDVLKRTPDVAGFAADATRKPTV